MKLVTVAAFGVGYVLGSRAGVNATSNSAGWRRPG